MALRRQRHAQIFQESKNVLEMFDDEQLSNGIVWTEQASYLLAIW